ncbi:MAG: hypothetical protein BM564_01230 [Bacteroidetes bacterium MedPE-SWsnd-G2]|nr:MAG: hypothetical protein BM564_01230 [Bacteroidetes bacterium MedPE-SWsnd-G2]
MIKLFRKIRYNLLSEGKTRKYFKYAIGEIVLVVIGILIALQINTWNENRKSENYEKTILKEIHTTIKDDLEIFGFLEDRLKKKDTAIDKLILARQNKVSLSEDDLLKYIRWSRWGIIFSYNQGPYETLKSSGLDKIKNDSLRFEITNYYDFTIPRAKSFFDFDKLRYKPLRDIEYKRLKDQGFYEEYFKSIINDNGDEGFSPRTKYNFDKYLNDPTFNETLLIEANYKNNLWGTLSNLIRRSETLQRILQKDLKTRFNMTFHD